VKSANLAHQLLLTTLQSGTFEKGNFSSNSRKAKISTTGIYRIFRGLKFEPDAEIG